MTDKTVSRIASFAAAGLAAVGGTHVAAGLYWAATRPLVPHPMRIDELSPEAFVWFAGGGLVFLLAAGLNLVVRHTSHAPRWYRPFRHLANMLVLAFLTALALIDPRPFGNAGVFLGLVFAALLAATAWLEPSTTDPAARH